MKIKETGFESDLRMKSLYFSEISFLRINENIDDIQLDLNITDSFEELSDDRFKVTLSASLTDNEGVINIKLTVIGIFELSKSSNLEPDKYEHVRRKNTVSIMFPYIRSQLSLLTTQPNLTPVTLNPMNINMMLEKHE